MDWNFRKGGSPPTPMGECASHRHCTFFFAPNFKNRSSCLMTKDEIVERLKNLKKIDKAIIILQRKLKELDNNYPHTSGSFEQKVSSSKVNTTEKKLINTLKKKDDIIDQIATLTEEKFATTDLINKLEEPEEWLALRMLYLHGYAVAEVCKEMKVSKATLYRARDRAVERLEAEVNNS